MEKEAFMQWYYAGKDGQVGPIGEEEFQTLANDGSITPKTLVWNSTMTDWSAYGKIGDGSTAQAESTGESRRLFCVECGRAFSSDEMIRFGSSWVCASCKPVFVQKLKEGVTTVSGMEYAGFWIRFGAVFIDGIIIGVGSIIIKFPILMLIFGSATSKETTAALSYVMLNNTINFGLGIAYETFFIGKYAATPGKMLCKLKVITTEGDKVTYLRAFGRYFGKLLSYLTLTIGFIMAAFDDEKRALHDRICSTRVIKV
ncbi:MAG: RDD family protein [Nitrospirae bacterium]|nr:MAG: RDD family protein [Nitrospirota bacterium]